MITLHLDQKILLRHGTMLPLISNLLGISAPWLHQNITTPLHICTNIPVVLKNVITGDIPKTCNTSP
jgi:hypothetical protein